VRKDPEIVKSLKRYLRQTWIYSVRQWVESHSPKGIKKQEKILSFYSQFLTANDLCFDVGANIGNRTEIFSKLGVKTISIEPQQVCLKHLHKRFDDDINVTILHTAVGEYEGYAELLVCEDASTISTLSNKWVANGRFSNEFQWNSKQSVPVTTLDNLIKDHGTPQFCKIDVEGFELSVLRGMTQPIQVISFEFNRELLDETIECIEYLEHLGYKDFNYSIGESMELNSSGWLASRKIINAINSINDELLWGDIYARFT